MKIISVKNRNTLKVNSTYNDYDIEENKATDIVTPPSNKEWDNTVYVFNKKVKHLPITNNIITTFIRRYLNMFDKTREKSIKIFHRSNRRRKNKGNKVWVGRTELKHSSDTVVINIYIYNRKNNYLVKRLNKNIKSIYTRKYDKLIKLRRKYKEKRNRWNKNIFYIIMKFYKKKVNKFTRKLETKKENFLYVRKLLKNNVHKYFYKNAYIKLIKRILKKELFILFFKQNIILNILKYRNTYITPLKIFLKKIYNKEIIFNIISLKNYHLDSKILTQVISTKAKNRKNRIAKLLRVALIKTSISTIKKRLIEREKKKLDQVKNLIIKDKIESFRVNDGLSFLIEKTYLNKFNEKTNTNILKSLKNKTISGIRLEAAGRLTKRFTAQRSIYKLKYKGTLKDIRSSYKGLPSSLTRNHVKSNMQYTYSKANNRIGAFGIKGWVSSR